MFHDAQSFVPTEPGPGLGLSDDRSARPAGLLPEAPLAMPVQILERGLRLGCLRVSAFEPPEEA